MIEYQLNISVRLGLHALTGVNGTTRASLRMYHYAAGVYIAAHTLDGSVVIRPRHPPDFDYIHSRGRGEVSHNCMFKCMCNFVVL